jgi:phosphate/sulfate permease
MSFWPAIIVGATLFVAYANGANDNFKGVATLFGSGTTDYRKALWWATLTTLAGSVTALFLANLVTSFLVIFASKWGLAVSTTHVSCGALFGIGVANGQARWNVIRTILLAWLSTLPTAALMAGLIYTVLSRLAAI